MAKRLITPDEVIQIAAPRSNLDQTMLKESFIRKAELKHLKPLLGKDFYNEIVTQVQTTPNTLTSDNETLLDDYIKNALAFYVIKEVIVYYAIDLTNAGVQVQSTEFTAPASATLRAELQQLVRDDGDAFRDLLVEFLEDQQLADPTKYPLYEGSENVNNDVKTIGGLVFDQDDLPKGADEGIDDGKSLRD